ncbi:MAG: hypothetical protein K0R65_320 [Crocinitomicaceae bacterium]|jgi:hypothetical protein|nr:hypothetical protein [Crocinitomicaceae bacterium]
MERKSHYGTVTEAITKLRAQGFTTDFNLEENCISCQPGKFGPEEFEIVDLYRYEGNSDPADEATVYAIESTSGIKGILVTGYGISSDTYSTEILKKLHSH